MKKVSLLIVASLVLTSSAFAGIFIECKDGQDFRMAAYSADGKFKGGNSGIEGEGWQLATQPGRWLPTDFAAAKYSKKSDTLEITVQGRGGRFTIYEVTGVSNDTAELEVTHISGRASPAGGGRCTVIRE